MPKPDIYHSRLSRHDALKATGYFGARLFISPTPHVKETATPVPFPETSLPSVLDSIKGLQIPEFNDTSKKQLSEYLQKIESEKRSLLKKIWDTHTFVGFRGKSRQTVYEDMDIYLPIYLAAGAIVPWQLLATIHFGETEASRNMRPENKNSGAMQINYTINTDIKKQMKMALETYRFSYLKFLPNLRYSSLNPHTASPTNDAVEIFAAAEFIKITAGNNDTAIKSRRNQAGDTWERKCLRTQLNYFGIFSENEGNYFQRVRRYNELKKATS